MMSDDEIEDTNDPDFGKVEYEVAIESIAKMFSDLRGVGLSRLDSAAIVAQIMKGDM